MKLTQTKTNQIDLLTRRLEIWDKIDQAYSAGLITHCIQLEKYVDEVLTPQIRGGYELYGVG